MLLLPVFWRKLPSVLFFLEGCKICQLQRLSQNWCSFSPDGLVTPSIGIPTKCSYSPGTLGNIKGKIVAELKFGTMLKDNSLMNIWNPASAPLWARPSTLKIGTKKTVFLIVAPQILIFMQKYFLPKLKRIKFSTKKVSFIFVLGSILTEIIVREICPRVKKNTEKQFFDRSSWNIDFYAKILLT